MQPVNDSILVIDEKLEIGLLLSGVFIQRALIGFSRPRAYPERVEAIAKRFWKCRLGSPIELCGARQWMQMFGDEESSLRT